jgi:two-component system, OmpR family, alkaline phosphatase synthesis response regulator PhoP
MARILIIEDDTALRTAVRSTLERDGYDVDEAGDGATGLGALTGGAYDAVLLDIGLPVVDGWRILGSLDSGRAPSVIVISARGEERDKVQALNMGADDYLAKPFGLGELLARVEALLRRRPPPPEKRERVGFGDVEVDLDAQTVQRKGAPVEVSPQEFKVLRLFLHSAGRALSREDILARCWGAEYEGTPRTVDNFVRSLRVKLEENAEEPRHFLTVRGHGYRFER